MRAFNVAYFTASCDDADTNRRFAESLELDYPILSDPGKETAKAFGVVNEDRPFPFRWTYYIGEDGKVLHIDKSVKAGSHGEDILAKLSTLGISKK